MLTRDKILTHLLLEIIALQARLELWTTAPALCDLAEPYAFMAQLSANGLVSLLRLDALPEIV